MNSNPSTVGINNTTDSENTNNDNNNSNNNNNKAPEKEIELEKKLSSAACEVLNELRKNGQLTDSVLKVKDGTFSVHRAMMSACSPYFRALYTNGMTESEMTTVELPSVDKDMMDLIVEYAYTRCVVITDDNVERLLPAADEFHVVGLVKSCCKFLQRKLDSTNVIGIRNFARQYFCTELDDHAQGFLMENFSEVAKVSNEMLNLNLNEMVEIVRSDNLNVKNEEVVFDAILRWIDHEATERVKFIIDLMKCIRLGLLSTQYFVEKVKTHPYVRDNDECRPIIIETLKFLYDLDMEGCKDVDLSHPLARPRIPHEVMFAVGGWSGGSPTNVIESYDTRADRWISIEDVDKGPRAYHGCVSVNMKVYLVGGFDGMDYFNSVRCFDPIQKKWLEVAPMNSRRCYVSCTVHNDLIYALGGFDGHLRQNTAERYTPATNQWSMLASMNHQRSDADAATLKNRIYIVGGFNGQECLNSSEYYDPKTNQWTMVTPMRNRRSGVGVIVHSNRLYAIGGFNGITRMNNGERYNIDTNQWQNIAEMYSPRSNFGIEVIDDMVFAIGGFNGVTTIFNVECYDPSNDEWYDCTDMNIYRSALSACVVKGLPNITEYIHKNRSKVEEKKKRTPASSH